MALNKGADEGIEVPDFLVELLNALGNSDVDLLFQVLAIVLIETRHTNNMSNLSLNDALDKGVVGQSISTWGWTIFFVALPHLQTPFGC